MFLPLDVSLNLISNFKMSNYSCNRCILTWDNETHSRVTVDGPACIKSVRPMDRRLHAAEWVLFCSPQWLKSLRHCQSWNSAQATLQAPAFHWCHPALLPCLMYRCWSSMWWPCRSPEGILLLPFIHGSWCQEGVQSNTGVRSQPLRYNLLLFCTRQHLFILINHNKLILT